MKKDGRQRKGGEKRAGGDRRKEERRMKMTRGWKKVKDGEVEDIFYQIKIWMINKCL